MQNRTANPECVYCYVATDRKAYREFLDYAAPRLMEVYQLLRRRAGL